MENKSIPKLKVYRVEFLSLCCEPYNKNKKQMFKNRKHVFGSPEHKPDTLASRRVIQHINIYLKKQKYPTIKLDKFFDIDYWWDPKTMTQTRSPLLWLPAISKQGDKAIFSKVTKGDGVWQFEYIANQDPMKREQHDIPVAIYVSFDGDILCSKANHQQIVDAGF